jgi:hypothetical protein
LDRYDDSRFAFERPVEVARLAWRSAMQLSAADHARIIEANACAD